MEKVLKKVLNTSIKQLLALEERAHIRFKVVTADGLEYGSLTIKNDKNKKKKKSSLYPYGEIRQYILPFVQNITPDQVVSIPIGRYDLETVRGNTCSWCTGAWGKGTYSSTVDKEKRTVEIYRFPA